MELVDAPHSKCGTFGFVGSSPTAPTALMETYKRFPIHIVRGKGTWVWDEKGRKYLDAVAGIASCSIGHSNNAMRRALTKQLNKIQHVSNLYGITEQEALAQWLVKNSCADKVFFCNSGAEANEAAIKLARKYGHEKLNIKEPIIISAKSSFHGRTLAALSATGQPTYHTGFEPLVKGFKFFTYNDIKSFKELLDELNKDGRKVAAILIEPLQGEGGIKPGDINFFKELREISLKNEILLIFDEVQTGVGRTGNWWGYEYLGVTPDAFTIAKGLGGGHAIGALLVKNNVNLFKPGEHATTFGGNPFACTAGLTVVNEITNRNLLHNVNLRGIELKEGLIRLSNKFDQNISGVRGIGLIQGLVIKEESNLTGQVFAKEALKENLLVVPAGEKVIRMVPPLSINKIEIKLLLERVRLTLSRLL